MWFRAHEMYAERSSIFYSGRHQHRYGYGGTESEREREGAHHDVDAAGRGSVLEVEPDEVPREAAVVDLVNLVEDEVEQVEPRDERRGEVNVARDGPVEVVLGPDRVRAGEDGRARVERRDDARLGDRDRLLLLGTRRGLAAVTARVEEDEP